MLKKLHLLAIARAKDVRYFAGALRLLATREITLQTFAYALRERPAAVCGRRGAWGLDDL